MIQVPVELSNSVQQLIPPGPVAVAMARPAQGDVLFAKFPARQPEWMPAAHWSFPAIPVVPVHPGQPPRAGKPIPPESMAALADPAERVRYLDWRISLLAVRPEQSRTRGTREEPVAPAVDAASLAEEAARAESLVASGDFQVLLTTPQVSPFLLAEIGRQREIAFRAVGEGTGRAYDLDRFDHSYQHLLVWNRAALEVAGAYRLRLSTPNPTDLYTATLFHYGPEFLNRLGPAIELGRSFINPKYQKSFTPLLLLWKAIGQVVARHPAHKTLFGPVSISNQYQAISRELMIAFLEKREILADLAALVRPRNAPERRADVTADYCRDVDELSAAIADVEPGRQGVPVLLRHYLRLGGKLLGFNVDSEFNNALDGLILVDLTRTDPRLLERYLGKPEAAAVLAFHHSRKGNHGTV